MFPFDPALKAQIPEWPRRTSSTRARSRRRDEHGHSDERGEWRGRRGRPAGPAARGPGWLRTRAAANYRQMFLVGTFFAMIIFFFLRSRIRT